MKRGVNWNSLNWKLLKLDIYRFKSCVTLKTNNEEQKFVLLLDKILLGIRESVPRLDAVDTEANKGLTGKYKACDVKIGLMKIQNNSEAWSLWNWISTFSSTFSFLLRGGVTRNKQVGGVSFKEKYELIKLNYYTSLRPKDGPNWRKKLIRNLGFVTQLGKIKAFTSKLRS